MNTRILIVDSNPITRYGLRSLLETEKDIRICADAENGSRIEELIEEHCPDVIIMDIDIETMTGISFIKQIKTAYSHIRVLVFSFLDETIYAERVLRAKAHGFLSKKESCEKIRWAVRSVINGGLCISQDLESKLVEQMFFEKQAKSPIDNLSNRELQILELISKGLKPSQVAESLNLSTKTVENYRANLRVKLNLKNASELFQYAIEWKTRRFSENQICA
ncbi:MAG: response regulator transcription factor [Candidatus Omnitrophica bacterium]|nr:response regulator transcription factor [Candidatus Omnitrophota bacterium]